MASNIIAYRDEHGALKSRDDLKKIHRLGPKAFEQAAGFLRIQGGKQALDASAVHPESYDIVEAMTRDLHCTVTELIESESLRKKIDLNRYTTEKVGIPTLTDILSEMAKPGRDPREQFEVFKFEEGIEKISDILPGMKLTGIVTNVTAFGAFVDVGVHQDGLVHISQLSNGFVKDPNKVVKVSQPVTVTVLDVDLERGRISLSMKTESKGESKKPAHGQKKTKTPPKTRTPEKRKPAPFNNPFSNALKK